MLLSPEKQWCMHGSIWPVTMTPCTREFPIFFFPGGLFPTPRNEERDNFPPPSSWSFTLVTHVTVVTQVTQVTQQEQQQQQQQQVYLVLVKSSSGLLSMLSSDWLSYYWAICPMVAKSSGLWKPKQRRLNHVLLSKVVLSQYFWPTSWILLKQLFPLPS